MWCIPATALVIVLPAAMAQDVEAEAGKYLTDFGHIENNGNTRPFLDETALNNAVSKFQDFAGLEKTVLIPTDELCGSRIDAIVQTSDGSPYVFKGDKYWKMTDDSLTPGYPRKISDSWPGLPSNIDAALTWKETGFTFFFKGNQYWRFTDSYPSPGYPKDISAWEGLPANLDAAFEWGLNTHLYFFKGSQYWKYDTDQKFMADGYPKDISSWQGVPTYIDAAFQLKNKKTYFFKSGKYWRFNDDTVEVDRANPSFPRDAGLWWFGCPKKKRFDPSLH